MPRSVAVIGAGWAGLAAAVEATRASHRVTLFETAPLAGGRAREVGVDTEAAFLRTPLRLTEPDGRGLHLPPGPPMLAFARGVWGRAGWTLRERLSLLAAATGWAAQGFRCAPGTTVESLTLGLGPVIVRDLIDPLCVAALNTPANEASAAVFLRVLRDALFSGAGSADLLLPRVSLGELFPAPATAWLNQRGVSVQMGTRVRELARDGAGWRVDGAPFDRVILATPPTEAARLAEPIDAPWSARAAAFGYEPIVTVYLQCDGTVLPAPMLALQAAEAAPAQFVLDRGQLGGPQGLLAFVISGARPWVDAGREATLEATLRQARGALGPLLAGPVEPRLLITEKRATFRCVPGLERPPMCIAPGLLAAGDHVDGPYPATLEGAVRSAVNAVEALA